MTWKWLLIKYYRKVEIGKMFFLSLSGQMNLSHFEPSRIPKCATWQPVHREHPDYSRDQNTVWGQDHNLSCRLTWESRRIRGALACECPRNHNHPEGLCVLWGILKKQAARLSFLHVSSLAEFRGLFWEERRFYWDYWRIWRFSASLYRKSLCVHGVRLLSWNTKIVLCLSTTINIYNSSP